MIKIKKKVKHTIYQKQTNKQTNKSIASSENLIKSYVLLTSIYNKKSYKNKNLTVITVFSLMWFSLWKTINLYESENVHLIYK
jgi:hypothetical protein